jgi:GT2 family glycosyltransferase
MFPRRSRGVRILPDEQVPLVNGRVTVVIATRNRREELARTLQCLQQLTPAPPVVVVDNSSTGGPRERCEPGSPR